MSLRPIIAKQFRLLPAVLLFFTLLAALLMTSDALQSSARFAHLYSPLLLVNGIGVVLLVALIGINGHHLFYQLRQRRAGAKLTMRLVALFIIMAAAPVLVVYYFSLEFLHQRLDSWLDVQVEKGMDNALELSRASLDTQMRSALQQTEQMAEKLVEATPATLVSQLDDLRAGSGAAELIVLTANGHLVAFNSAETNQLLPHRPDDGVLLQMKKRQSYIGLEPLQERGLHVRVVISLATLNESAERPAQPAQPLLLSALFAVPERVGKLATEVETASGEYKQLAYLLNSLKISFTLVLSLVLLLSIFSAVWIAFLSARRLVSPLRELAEGTQAVAQGDYTKRVPLGELEEISFLAQSFNDMTRKLHLTHGEAERSRELVDAQRDYLEAVLGRLSSGVLSLDHEQRLRTSNAAAEAILGLPLSTLSGENFVSLCAGNPLLQPLCQTLEPHLRNDASGQKDWQEQLTLFGAGGRKILMCRGASLPDNSENRRGGGYVIVFDDVTTLLQAQRDAAWSEVARRLAHEIKNPLTPIQLSAERLRHKFMPGLSGKEAEVMDRMTHTIVQQVESMKEMVNAFSNYARPPELQFKRIQLNQLINEVLDLYCANHECLELSLDTQLPMLDADPGRLRQVLHNLLKNALEAMPAQLKVHISSQFKQEATASYVELRVQDNGPGIPEELRAHVFEPYVTTKTKGTGLGLAIVKKIIEEHGGMVWMEYQEGTCAVIRLPALLPQACEPPATQIEYA
jgi:nitrogen fixation/metabolism regulation signal transduction histidine kinase